MLFTVLFYRSYLSARPWLRDDLDTWIERSKVRPFFHSFVLSFLRSSWVRSFVLLSLVRSLVLPYLIRSYACPSDLSYIYSRDKKLQFAVFFFAGSAS